MERDGLVNGDAPGKMRSGTNVVWQLVKPPPTGVDAPQNFGDIALSAAVEPETSLRGLNVLIWDPEDLALAVVKPRPAMSADAGAGVISLRLEGTGAIAAFFMASISRLRNSISINIEQRRVNSPQLIILRSTTHQLCFDSINQPISILDMILQFIDVRLPTRPKRSRAQLVAQLTLLL